MEREKKARGEAKKFIYFFFFLSYTFTKDIMFQRMNPYTIFLSYIYVIWVDIWGHNLKSWIYNELHTHQTQPNIEMWISTHENVCFTFDILKPFYGRFDNKLRILLCFFLALTSKCVPHPIYIYRKTFSILLQKMYKFLCFMKFKMQISWMGVVRLMARLILWFYKGKMLNLTATMF